MWNEIFIVAKKNYRRGRAGEPGFPAKLFDLSYFKSDMSTGAPKLETLKTIRRFFQ